MSDSDAFASTQHERWLIAAREGDGVALGHLLDAHRGRLLAAIDADLHGPLQRRVDASDVVQLACVQAVRSFERFRGSSLGEFWNWLEQIERNMLIDLVREHGAQRRDARIEKSGNQPNDPAARATTASQHAIRGERRRELERAIAQLPEAQREAVRLRYLREWKVADIANELDRTEEAIAGLLKRGVKSLKSILQDRSL